MTTISPRARRLALGSAIAALFGVIATPGAAHATLCPNEQLRQESTVNPATHEPYDTSLPECRAYEVVSPQEKQAHNAEPGPNGGPLVSPDGNAVGYVGQGAFLGSENYHVIGVTPTNPYISKRTGAGWITEPALVPANVLSDPTDAGFGGDASPDLSILATCGWAELTTGGGGGSTFGCSRRDANGTWSTTPMYAGLTGSSSGSLPVVWGASSDGRVVIWQPGLGNALLLGDEVLAGTGAIYETVGLGTDHPQLRLVSVSNDGLPLTTNHGHEGPYLGAARSAPSVEGSLFQAISSDGETVYFTAEPAGGGPLTLYARTSDFAGGTFERPATVSLGEGATFVGASSNGSKVFFVTSQRLVAADHDSTGDLYMYDFDAPPGHQYTDISAGTTSDSAPGVGAEVKSGEFTSGEPRYGSVAGSVVALSTDGSHIYFYAKADLTTAPNAAGEHAGASGGTYGYDTETGETKLVVPFEIETTGAAVTPNGESLVFDTSDHLTPEDTNPGQAIYRYSFTTGEVTWVSHPAESFPAANEGDNARLAPREEALNGRDGAMSFFQDGRRAISENGEDVIFVTKERLQASDINGETNVYLWHDGQVTLISDGGAGGGIVEWPGMSASGNDIFFGTAAKLVGQDTDELEDIYDARVNGGFPAPTPEASCSGEECQGTPSAAPPGLKAEGSSLAIASGNLSAAPFVISAAEETSPREVRTVKVTGHSTKSLSVSAPGAGTLTLFGTGLAAAKKSATKAGSYTLPIALTAAEQKLLAKRASVTLTVRVKFIPTSGKPSTATARVTIKKAKPKAKTKSRKKK